MWYSEGDGLCTVYRHTVASIVIVIIVHCLSDGSAHGLIVHLGILLRHTQSVHYVQQHWRDVLRTGVEGTPKNWSR